MIDNGYIIETDDIYGTVTQLRASFKDVPTRLVHQQIAEVTADLQDMAFALGAKFEDSILATALNFVQGRIEGVRNGIYSDDRYDFRSSLSFCKAQVEGKEVWLCLLNTINPIVKLFFEQQNCVKYFGFNDNEQNDAQNMARGAIWQEVLEQASWNAAQIGLTAQLTFQPDISDMRQDTSLFDKIKRYFPEPSMRSERFCHRHIVQNYVSKRIGKTDISQISPSVLTGFFIEAMRYVATEKGENEYKALLRDWEKAFLPVTITNVTASPETDE